MAGAAQARHSPCFHLQPCCSDKCWASVLVWTRGTVPCDVQSLATRTETGEGELGRSRIITSGLVGGKEEEHPCVGQVRVWMLLPDTEWGVELYSC